MGTGSKRRAVRGTKPLTECARHLVRPAGIVASGWPAVSRVLVLLGIVLDEWQVGLAKLMLAKRKDGKYAADTVVLSIPRQVGKTFFLGSVIFALCLIRPRSTWLWTAHRSKTAGETFRGMKALAQMPLVAPFIERTPSSGEEKAIVFRNGSRILFGAREHGFGRGFADVDGIVFDEAQILTQDAVDDMVPSTSVAENPLVIFAGTPPRPIDPGEMFTTYRREALAGESDAVLYCEFSARRRGKDAPDPLDRDAWSEANPSYPMRTDERAILRFRKLLAKDSFIREVLGVWDEQLAQVAIPRWDARRDVSLRGEGRPGIDVVAASAAPDGSFASIGAACLDEDEHLVVGLVERRAGTGWVRAELERLQTEHGVDVVLDKTGPLSHLVDELDDVGVVVDELKHADCVEACTVLWQAVEDGELRHPGHPDLDSQVRTATWKKAGKRRVLDSEGAGGPIDALEAVAYAAHQARLSAGFDVH